MKNKFSHRRLRLLFTTVLVSVAFYASIYNPRPVPAQPVRYADLSGHWVAEKAALLFNKGITKGITGGGNGYFKPDEKITRAAYVKMLVQALEPAPKGEDGTAEVNRQVGATVYREAYGVQPRFTDVPTEHWAGSVIEAAYQAGLIKGAQGGMFYPENPIQRSEAAVLLYRAMVLKNRAEEKVYFRALLPYRDYRTVPDWAVAAVGTVREKGIMKGFKDGTFRPGGYLTRAEAVAAVYGLLEVLGRDGDELAREFQVPVLMYHHLALPGQYPLKNNSVVTPDMFEAQMKALKEAGFTAISLSRLRTYLAEGQPLPPRPVVITFDDGYESNYVYAFPVLKRYGHKATINIVVKSTLEAVANSVYGTAGVGFDAGKQTHLTWAQMKEMVDSGLVEVQSHTFDSHSLIVIDPRGKKGKALVNRAYLMDQKRLETPEEYRARIYADLARAKQEIETNLGVKVTGLAYPYGAYNGVVKEVALDLGYNVALTIDYGHNSKDTDPMALKRINVSPTDSLEVFLHRLAGE